MLAWVVLLQLTVIASPYTTPALRTLVERASTNNRNLPQQIRAYEATVETEVAVTIRQGQHNEAPVSLEQLASVVRWNSPGDFDQHVIGDRLQAVGPQLTALTFMQQSLLVPHLYGNSLPLMFGRDNATRGRRSKRSVAPVHPLGDEREQTYLFSGGDTVETLMFDARRVPVVRVVVTPRDHLPENRIVFNGELFLDATRAHLVRMRGRIYAVGDSRGLLERAVTSGFEGALYVELENQEIAQEIWLPAKQRFEAQVLFRISSDTRSVFRATSTFRHYQVDGDTGTIRTSVDTLEARPHRLTLAPGDSIGRFTTWTSPLGDATANARAEDFDDVAPEAWKATGPPRIDIRFRRLADLVRFNRIEGWFTGLSLELNARDAAPGLRISAAGGRAWQEETVRGHVDVEWSHRGHRFGLTLNRTLDNTNDFRAPLDSGSTLGALFGVDDYDYVSRQTVAGTWRYEWNASQRVVSTLQLARVRDSDVQMNVFRSPIGIGSDFRVNRGVTGGVYTRGTATLTVNPRITLGFIQPGFGAQASLQAGNGSFQYQRLEGRGIARWHSGRTTVAGRLDAGAVWGRSLPPQQLLEVGAAQNLLGYDYKAFAGNRAVVVRGMAMQTLPVFAAPFRVTPRVLLPAPTPALVLSVQSAWVGLSGDAASRALQILTLPTPTQGTLASCTGAPSHGEGGPTCHWRTSMGVGLRFFGGALGVDVARPVDHQGRWRFQLALGQAL
ncbi:MAG: hypothetical protein U0132_16325 [Gemmatimonadaceae bacterium]